MGTINVLSLFDGLGGARIALDRLGISCHYYASEIDKYAIKIAQKNYPDIQQLGNICEIKNIPFKVDLLIGGSPCQGFSFNGKQLNFQDTRSKLFWEFVRLLYITKPKYFLLENVKMSEKSLTVISNSVGCKPKLINSNLFVPQDRKRLYWTNLDIKNLPTGIPPLVLKSILLPRSMCEDVTQKICFKKYGTQAFNNMLKFIRVPSEQARCLMASGQGVNNHGATNVLIKGKIYKLHPIECERLQGVPDNYTKGVACGQRYKMLGNGFTIPVIEHILSHMEIT